MKHDGLTARKNGLKMIITLILVSEQPVVCLDQNNKTSISYISSCIPACSSIWTVHSNIVWIEELRLIWCWSSINQNYTLPHMMIMFRLGEWLLCTLIEGLINMDLIPSNNKHLQSHSRQLKGVTDAGPLSISQWAAGRDQTEAVRRNMLRRMRNQ